MIVGSRTSVTNSGGTFDFVLSSVSMLGESGLGFPTEGR